MEAKSNGMCVVFFTLVGDSGLNECPHDISFAPENSTISIQFKKKQDEKCHRADLQ